MCIISQNQQIHKMRNIILLFIIFLVSTISNVCLAQIDYPKTDIEEYNSGGVFIHINPDSLDANDFIEKVYGEIEIYSKHEIYYTRNSGLRPIRISYFEDGIFICDDETGMDIVKNLHSAIRKKIENYFSTKPLQLFAIIAFESGASYGYRLVETGKTESAAFTHSSGYSYCREGRILEKEIEVLSDRKIRYPNYDIIAVITELVSLEKYDRLVLSRSDNNHFFYVKENSD